MIPETYIELSLVFDNDYDVKNITKLTGIIPFECKNRNKNNLSPLTNQQLEAFWTLKSSVCCNYDIKPAIDDIIAKIHSNISSLRDICEKEKGEAIFWIVSYFAPSSPPCLELPKEIIEVAYKLNASIRFDLYAD